MKKIDVIIEKLRKNKPVVEKKYGVKNLEVSGSYIRGEQKKGSDLDILVEFHRTIDLFKYIELENFLSKKPGVKVDLIMKHAETTHKGQDIERSSSRMKNID